MKDTLEPVLNKHEDFNKNVSKKIFERIDDLQKLCIKNKEEIRNMTTVAERMKSFKKDSDAKDKKHDEKLDRFHNEMAMNSRDIKMLNALTEE